MNADLAKEEPEFADVIKRDLPVHRMAAKAYIKEKQDDEGLYGYFMIK